MKIVRRHQDCEQGHAVYEYLCEKHGYVHVDCTGFWCPECEAELYTTPTSEEEEEENEENKP